MTRRPDQPVASALFECVVRHERFTPRRHAFSYRVFYLALDLDELPLLDRRLRLFSAGRRNAVSVAERDYLPTSEPPHGATRATPRAGPADTLKARVTALCSAQGVELGAAPRVVLVTLPRVLGYQFNPVSFFFACDPDGTPRAAIAEVTNTFREVKPFVLRPEPGGGDARVFRLRTAKEFYVSPFSPVDALFDFTLRPPGATLAIAIDDYIGDRRTLHSTLIGRRVPLTDARLAWNLLTCPLLTLKVTAGIHWEAFRLWAKRVPYFRKTDDAARQRDLYRPHASLQAHRS